MRCISGHVTHILLENEERTRSPHANESGSHLIMTIDSSQLCRGASGKKNVGRQLHNLDMEEWRMRHSRR